MAAGALMLTTSHSLPMCRNFQGFAKELFTDAGKYVVHFGFDAQRAAEIEQATLQARSGRDDVQVTPLAVARTDVAVIPTVTGNQLVGVLRLCGFRKQGASWG